MGVTAPRCSVDPAASRPFWPTSRPAPHGRIGRCGPGRRGS